MDVNVNAEVKVYGAPVTPVIEQEDRVKPQVAPVQKSSASENGSLSDKALHGGSKNGEEEKAAAATRKLSQEEAQQMVNVVQERLDSIGGNLSLGLTEHSKSESIVVQIRDKANHEVVRQFPSEELLELQSKLDDLVGLLFDQKA